MLAASSTGTQVQELYTGMDSATAAPASRADCGTRPADEFARNVHRAPRGPLQGVDSEICNPTRTSYLKACGSAETRKCGEATAPGETVKGATEGLGEQVSSKH